MRKMKVVIPWLVCLFTTSAADKPISVVPIGADTILIRFSLVQERSYTLLQSTNLQDWSPLANVFLGEPNKLLKSEEVGFFLIRENGVIQKQAVAVFVNAAADPTSAVVRSEFNPIPTSLPSGVVGSKYFMNVFLVDGEGNFSNESGAVSFVPEIVIGHDGNAWVKSSDFVPIPHGWQMLIDLTSPVVRDSISGNSVEVVWQFRARAADGSSDRIYAQVRMILKKGL